MSINDVLNFWFKELSPSDWFKKDARIDQDIRDRFSSLWLKASRGELASWRETKEGRLAEIIVLDQFSRNLHRESKKAFQNDELALKLAEEMVNLGLDKELRPEQRAFVYLPYVHSEKMEFHFRAEELLSAAGLMENLDYERKHRVILEKFGRYPHRNKILGRKSTPAEVQFLKGPDSSF